MADVTLAVGGRFADGTSLGTYPVSRWPAGSVPSGAPIGSSVNSQSVSNQSVTFTGLTAGTYYYVTDSSGTRYVRISAGVGVASIIEGRKIVTTAGTRVQLASESTKVREVTLTAETDNTGIVVVGGSGVIASLATRVGTPLPAGVSYTITAATLTGDDDDDLSLDLLDVYLDSTVSTDGVTFSAVVA